jgi:hypothetical protein
LEAEIGPGPFPKDLQTIAEADQEIDVHQQPSQPGDKAGEVQASDLGDAGVAADSG